LICHHEYIDHHGQENSNGLTRSIHEAARFDREEESAVNGTGWSLQRPN